MQFLTKQLHHSLKGDLSSELQVLEASIVKDIQSRLEMGGFYVFLIHIFVTGGGNRGLFSLVYLFPAKSSHASGFARSPAHPSDKALSPEEQLPRVHAPCLVCARRCEGWRKQVSVGAPLQSRRNACSPPCCSLVLAELFQKIAFFFFFRKRSLFLQ